MTSLINLQNKHLLKIDQKIEIIQADIVDHQNQINKKMSNTDGQRLWRQQLRFAEYCDFKQLYNKVIPEISKFEDKL